MEKLSVIEEFKAGDKIFIYDFENMPVDQILAAENMFKMQAKSYTMLPAQPSEIDIVIQRKYNSKALGCLLMEQVSEGTYSKFDAVKHTGWDAMSIIKGKDIPRLEKCKEDFFFRMRLVSLESIEQSKAAMQMLKDLDSGNLEQILKAATTGDIDSIKMNMPDFTIDTLPTESSEKTATDKPSGLQLKTAPGKKEKS